VKLPQIAKVFNCLSRQSSLPVAVAETLVQHGHAVASVQLSFGLALSLPQSENKNLSDRMLCNLAYALSGLQIQLSLPFLSFSLALYIFCPLLSLSLCSAAA